jgi:hypothetical protein
MMEFTHIANPVRVKGQVIAEVTSADDGYGTKLTLADGTNYVVSDSMTVRHYPVPGDYLVTQEDGYIYVNPKDVFERKYAAVVIGGWNFSEALYAIKSGHRVVREGWNGKGMWVCLGAGNPAVAAADFWNQHTRQFALDNGGTAQVQPYLLMKNAQGVIQMGWAPTQSDLLADDWYIVE